MNRNDPIYKRTTRGLANAIATTMMLFAFAVPTFASPGHDHGEDAPAASGSGPKRLPDGGVFLPKPAQRQIGVLTRPVETGALPRTVELQGKVVMDPNAGGRVQPMQAGRIEPGPRGLPTLGQAVRKGEVLAFVVPSTGALERSNQTAQVGELRAARELAQKRLARLRELSDTVPRKEIEVAESEIESLSARLTAVTAGLSTREALVAPVSGVVASAQVVSGQVVDARELLFEVVDPARMRIEALAYDTDLVNDIASASITIGGERVVLKFVGAARSLREQALPLNFHASGPALSKLALGQPVRVSVQSAATLQAIRVPAAALMKNPSNQTVVWVKTAPERFDPRVVTFEPLDGTSVAVTSGLKPGDRIAIEGSTLINQIR